MRFDEKRKDPGERLVKTRTPEAERVIAEKREIRDGDGSKRPERAR